MKEPMMKVTADRLATLRRVLLGATGLTCVTYALAAVVLGRPDPFSPWIPGLVGATAAIVIAVAGLLAGGSVAEQATDEGYVADSHRAQRLGFWFALALYPVFGIALAQGWVSFQTAFVAMATLTSAAFLLLFVLFDLRGLA